MVYTARLTFDSTTTAYVTKAKDWKAQNTKSDFISKVKKETKDSKLKGGRADRVRVAHH